MDHASATRHRRRRSPRAAEPERPPRPASPPAAAAAPRHSRRRHCCRVPHSTSVRQGRNRRESRAPPHGRHSPSASARARQATGDGRIGARHLLRRQQLGPAGERTQPIRIECHALTLRGRGADLKGSKRRMRMTQVAVVGAGLIGRAWSIVFARAGFDVALWDPYPQQVEAALAFIGERLPELEEAGLLEGSAGSVAGRVRPVRHAWRKRWRARSTCRRTDRSAWTRSRRCSPNWTAPRVARRGARQLEQRHSCQRLHRGPGRPGALPGRASGEPALSGPAGRTVPRAMDRSSGGVADARADDQCGPGAGDGQQGDGRLSR